MTGIELNEEGWIQITHQAKSSGMYRSGAEEGQPRHFQVCRARQSAHTWTCQKTVRAGLLLQVSTMRILQPKASPVGMGLENCLKPHRQELRPGKEGCCEQAGVFYLYCGVGCENLIIWGPGRPKSQSQGMTEHSEYMKSSSLCIRGRGGTGKGR